jgi:uncharacterized Zn-finger protein
LSRQVYCMVCKTAPLVARGVPKAMVGASIGALRSFSAGPQYTDGMHRSNAEELVNKVPVIECDAHVAICDGGSGALGHPVEYIQLDTISNEPQICKYCGLRFKMAHH